MRHLLLTTLLLAIMSTQSYAQEVEDSKKALTSTGLVFHAGEISRNCGILSSGLMLDMGKRIVPQLQLGAGVMPSVNVDRDYYIDYINDEVVEFDSHLYYERKGAFFTMPIYAWVKYDFMKRTASPFIYANIGSQISNYKNARGGFYRGINAGCRIAIHQIALSPFIGYFAEGADYENIAKGGKGISAGIFVEF